MARNAILSSIAPRALTSLLIAAWSSAGAQAIDPLRSTEIVSDAAALDDKRTGKARFFDPADGQLDLSYFLENPKGFLPIPIVITEPAVGYGGGVAGMFLRPRREAGDEGWSRPDISGVGAFATQNGTWGAFGGDATPLDRRSLAHDGRRRHRSRQPRLLRARPRACRTFNEAVSYSLQFSGAVAQANWQLAPKSPWSVGMRYVYANVEPSLRDESARFPAWPIASASRCRHRRPCSSSTRATTCSRRRRASTPSRRTSHRAKRWARASTSSASSRSLHRLASASARRHARGTCELRVVVRGDAVLPAALRPAAWRPGDALPGRPGRIARGRGALAVHRPLERRRVRRRRHDAHRATSAFNATQNVGSGGVGFRYELASKFGSARRHRRRAQPRHDGVLPRRGQCVVPAVGSHHARNTLVPFAA